MVFFEAIHALFSLDLTFFIDIFMNNLLWVFFFYTMIHFFFEGKKTLYFTILFAVLMWAWTDLEVLTGLFWSSSSFLLLYYMTKLGIVALTEGSPSLKKYTIIISSLQFYILFLAFNFFFM